MDIKKILNNRDVSNYINNIYSIDNDDFPFLTYVGINFSCEEILNIKFYFSFFKRLNITELKKVLPVNDISDFNLYYNLWKESKIYSSLHQGATFAIKITPLEKLTHYFHLRLNVLNTTSTFDFSDTEPKNKGICKEYDLEKTSTKNYFYYDSKAVIQNLSERFGILNSKFDINSFDEIECVESEKKQKIDLITKDTNFIDEFLNQKTSPEIKNYFKKMCEDLNFIMYSPGINATGKIFSIYFIDKDCSNAYIPFDGVKKFIENNN